MIPARLFHPSTVAAVATLLALSPAQAASISAESMVCNGYTGSLDNLRAACGMGSAGGGGAVVIGGSGAGSGIAFPFLSDGFGSEFSASAAALQDYGIFRGYAQMHIVEQNPNIFGGGGGARAAGEFTDTVTIGGGVGRGRLALSFTVTGNGQADVFATNGGSPSAQADISISVRMNGVFGGAIVAHQSGTYALAPEGSDALVFTFGVPFDLNVLSVVSAGGGYNRFGPPDFFQLDANASFEHTSTLTGFEATDLFGTPLPGISVTASSGTRYPLTVPSIPEPSEWALLGVGLVALGALGRRGVVRSARSAGRTEH